MFDFKNITQTIRLGLLVVAVLSYFSRPVSAEVDQEYAVRAGLASNLARFTTWPDAAVASMGKNITLCLVGNPDLEETFTNLNGKTIGEKILQVRYLSRLNNLNECQLIYISELDKNKLLLLINEIKSLPILTIGEDDFFIKNGGMVSLQIINGKVSITVNLNAAKNSNLSISARVLKLATVIQ
ncbi:MAG: YfiR family protein [Methylococcaceae bacterium]